MRVGTFVRKRLEHARNERRSRAEIKALQLRKFRRIVAYANRHSPYYRDLIAARGIDVATCVPTDFPPLTKPELMANFDRIVTDPRITAAGIEAFLLRSHDPRDLYLDRYTIIHTSGSSGTIGYFVSSPAEQTVGTALTVRTFPFALRRRKIATYGLLGGHYGGATGVAESRRPAARLRFDSRPFNILDPLPQTLAKLNAFQPHILLAYPSAMIELVRAQEAGGLRIAPKLLSVGGEPLTPENRTYFERVFGVPISNHYGTSEHTIMGYGLSKDRGMYLFEDELIFEIDEDRALITNLFRTTQPLIRCAIDDRLEPVEDPDPRLPFIKIGDVQGRPKPSPIFTNRHGRDAPLSGHIFVEFFVPNVERIELRVFDRRSCVLRVKLRRDLSEPERQEALARSKRRLDEIFESNDMGNVSRRVEEVELFAGWKPRVIVLPDMVDSPPTSAAVAAETQPS